MKKSDKYNIDGESAAAAMEAAVSYGGGLRIVDRSDLQNRHTFLKVVREGLAHEELFTLMKIADLHIEEMAKILHITSRTIRRLDESEPLNIDISERVLSIINLYKLGVDTFGDLGIFNTWMRRSIKGLGDVAPVTLLDTSVGIMIVREELERLRYGVYS